MRKFYVEMTTQLRATGTCCKGKWVVELERPEGDIIARVEAEAQKVALAANHIPLQVHWIDEFIDGQLVKPEPGTNAARNK